MPLDLPPDELEALVHSLRRYLAEEFDIEASEMKTKFMLNYIWEEIGPFAYNEGVRDAEAYFRARVEDLPATCFRDGLTYWRKR